MRDRYFRPQCFGPAKERGVIWFQLWWFAMRQGLWRDPRGAVRTFAQTAKVVVILRMQRREVA